MGSVLAKQTQHPAADRGEVCPARAVAKYGRSIYAGIAARLQAAMPLLQRARSSTRFRCVRPDGYRGEA
jgi:hypothetical protein